MIPLASSLMYIILNEIIDARDVKVKHGKLEPIDKKKFKSRMSILMILRFIFTLICTALTAIFFREPTSRYNDNGPPKPIPHQLRDCLSDGIFYLFLLAPLLSSGMIEAGNNHLFRITNAFGFSYVRSILIFLDVGSYCKADNLGKLNSRRPILHCIFPAKKAPAFLPHFLQHIFVILRYT